MKARLFLFAALFSICMAAGSQVRASSLDACAQHLPFGIPTAHILSDLTVPMQAVCHPGYAALVQDLSHVTRWLAYRLEPDQVSDCIPQKGVFHSDADLPADAQPSLEDYKGTYFTPLQLAPAEDFFSDSAQLADSYSMTNTLPQWGGFTQRDWYYLEAAIRSWVRLRGALIVYTGPVLSLVSEKVGTIPAPVAIWKVIVDAKSHQALGFIISQGFHFQPSGIHELEDLKVYQASIDEVERWGAVAIPLPPDVNRVRKIPMWKTGLTTNGPHNVACLDKPWLPK